MSRRKTLEETYDSCLADGKINTAIEVNTQKLRDLLNNAQTNINSAEILIKALGAKNREWMNVYIDYYEALRIYAEALLSLDKLKVENHQCLFACLCVKYPHLELDWDFFEQIRTKRNGANYYGEQITYADWKSIELQMKLYISTLKKEIEKRISELE